MQLETWALRHGVNLAALRELYVDVLHLDYDGAPAHAGMSESAVQSRVRLEAARKGVLLWRNNVGVLEDKNGRPVRYGLCNDTPALNRALKSHDLVGLRPRLITAADVGKTIGQFVSREVKEGGWRYTGTPREVAQLAFAHLVNAHGGDAAFANAEGTL
jgi:hypothetical protein